MAVIKRIAGIDPGLDGSLALIAPDGLHVTRMPTYREDKNGKSARFVDADGVASVLRKWNPERIVIEDVWSSEQMGVVSAFSFGEGKGILIGVAAALGMEVLWVPPAAWKSALGVTKDKKTSIALAQKLFPSASKLVRRADDAEAALLAMYGLIKLGQVSTK